MKRPLALATLALLAVTVLPLATSAAVQATPPRAYEEISRCLNSKDVLNVYFLVDASGSLQDTDPQDKRAEVLATALEQFAGAREGAQVNFALGTFGAVFTAQLPWMRVDGAKLAYAKKWIQDNVPTLDTEDHTDWLVGLRKAAAALNAAPHSTNSCKVLLWLTDGGINVPGKSVSVDADAIYSLCASNPMTGKTGSGGLVDSLRRDNVTLIGVLLKSTSYLQDIQTSDPEEYASHVSRMSYMRPIVESAGSVDGSYFGRGSSDFTCGESPVPASANSGVLVEVEDANDLGLNFARIWLNASGGQPGKVTGDDPFEVLLEPGVSRAVLLIQGKSWTLTDPSGSVVATNKQVTGARVRTLSAGSVSQVSIDAAQSSARGKWVVSGPKSVELYLYTDLSLDLVSQLEFGQPAALTGHATDLTGKPVSLRDYGSAKVTVTSIVEGGSQTPVPLNLNRETGEFSGSFTPPDGVTHAIFDVRLELTTQTGQVLKPVDKRIEQDVALGPEYPQISPAKLQFTELAGPSGTGKAVLHFVGSKVDDTKICFMNAEVTSDPLPERIENYQFATDAANNCIVVQKGQESDLQISVTNQQGAEGLTQGLLKLSVSPTEADSRELKVPYEMVTSWPPNMPVYWAILFGLSLLSIVLPLLFLYGVNSRNARLIAGPLMMRMQIPVVVSELGVRGPKTYENANPTSLVIDPRAYQFVPAEDRPKSYSDATGAILKGKTSVNPFGSPKVLLTPPAGSQIVARPGLGTDLGDAWFITLSDGNLGQEPGSAIDATLVSYLRSDGNPTQAVEQRTVEISQSPVWGDLGKLLRQTKSNPTSTVRKPETETRSDIWSDGGTVGGSKLDAAQPGDIWATPNESSTSTGSDNTELDWNN